MKISPKILYVIFLGVSATASDGGSRGDMLKTARKQVKDVSGLILSNQRELINIYEKFITNVLVTLDEDTPPKAPAKKLEKLNQAASQIQEEMYSFITKMKKSQ